MLFPYTMVNLLRVILGLLPVKPNAFIVTVILTLSLAIHAFCQDTVREKAGVYPNPYPQYYLGTQLVPDGTNSSAMFDHTPNSMATTCGNSDFSEGNFTSWEGCYGGFATPCDNTGFNSTRHVIMPRANQTYDPFIGSPLTTVFPGEEYSARLGDTLEGNHSEQLRYTVSVTPSHFLFIYRWAAVLESVGHQPSQMPKFSLQVEDMAGNAIGGTCGFYEFVAPNCSPPGPSCIVPDEWHYFPVTNPAIILYWHDWTTIALDLSPFESLGNVKIVFTTRGCALQIHRGYAYLSTYCGQLANQISMCANSAQATLTAPPGFSAYEWRGPGLTGPVISSTQSVVITSPQPNDMYYVNLTAANGCVVNDLSQEIRATVVNSDFITTPHCAGEATSFLDASTTNQNTIVYWHWMFGDGNPDLGGIPNPTHVYSLPGTYTVTLNAYSTEGCMGSTSHEITIPAIMTPTLTGPVTTCANGTGMKYTTEPGKTNYVWTFPPGTTVVAGGTASADSAVLSWTNAGNYTIGVIYTNNPASCSPSGPATVTVSVGAVAPPLLTGENSVCIGSSSQTYTTQAGKVNYTWTIPPEAQLVAGGTDSENFATVNWLSAGNFTIGVNYSEPLTLCTPLSPATLGITVKAGPGAAGTILGPTSVCRNTTHSYLVPAIPNATSCLWQYSGTGVTIVHLSDTAISITFTAAATGGTLTVKGVNSCGDGALSPPLNILVQEIPSVTFVPCFDLVTTPGARKIILKGGTPWVQGQGVFSGTRVTLNPVSGLYEFNPFGASPGNYQVTYSFTNSGGCIAAAAPVTITVQNSPFSCGGDLTDVRDGRKYKTVMLSGHCWMKENLAYGKHIEPPGVVQSDNCRAEKYCSPVDTACTIYGGLYLWDELMDYLPATAAKGICPPAWHVPSEAEWQALIDDLVPGTPLSHTSSTLAEPMKDPYLSNGFQTIMKGLEYNSNYWTFFNGVVTGTMFWTSTECTSVKAVSRGLNIINPSISWYCNTRGNAFSQRCVKD